MNTIMKLVAQQFVPPEYDLANLLMEATDLRNAMVEPDEKRWLAHLVYVTVSIFLDKYIHELQVLLDIGVVYSGVMPFDARYFDKVMKEVFADEDTTSVSDGSSNEV